jgi:hypothetical protein
MAVVQLSAVAIDPCAEYWLVPLATLKELVEPLTCEVTEPTTEPLTVVGADGAPVANALAAARARAATINFFMFSP